MTPQTSSEPWNKSGLQTIPSELSVSDSSKSARTPLSALTSSGEVAPEAPDDVKSKFQKKLEQSNNDFGKALIEVFEDLVKLKIVTWVANKGESEEAGNRLKTTINLIDGDIENEIGANFLQGYPYFELREFHQKQCEEGALIIKRNLEILVDMGTKVADLLDSKKTPSS